MKPRGLTILCAAYLLVLVYASWMPFELTTDPGQVAEQIDYLRRVWPVGPVVRLSKSDMLSNVLLYIPLGALLATRFARGPLGPVLAAITAGLIGAGTSATVELGQLFVENRVSHVPDVLANTLGTVIGAGIGAAAGPKIWVSVRWSFRRRSRKQPELVLAVLLAGARVLAALWPLIPTIRPEEVWDGLKRSHLRPVAGLSRAPWHEWAVLDALPWGVLAVLVARSLRPVGWRRWLSAGTMVAGGALVLELTKPFFVSRRADLPAVLAGWAGIVCALLIGGVFSGRGSRRSWGWVVAVTVVGYAAYTAWRPFTFSMDLEAALARLPRGRRWLPIADFAMGGRLQDVYLFGRGVLLGATVCGAVGVARARALPAWLAGISMTVLAACLEGGQLFLDGVRTPSTADLPAWALGGVLGSGAIGHWLARRRVYLRALAAAQDRAGRASQPDVDPAAKPPGRSGR